MTMLWVDQVIFVTLFLFMRMQKRVSHNEHKVLPSSYSFLHNDGSGRKKELEVEEVEEEEGRNV